MQINSAKELTVYQEAYNLAMEIFEISKQRPPEEKYSLIDQVDHPAQSVQICVRRGRKGDIKHISSVN